MTESEFLKIENAYYMETEKWQNLKVGQIVYEFDGYDNFKHEIVSVDVPNRILMATDHSLRTRPIKRLIHWNTEPQRGM